ncbi:manganese efflux pump MntP family protein [uncultured Rikenella sp.]|uniref:manganese efflux pump MntP n=1 Tax=uncultured Rikenella sp. TaxID=368003 RepID=UPI00261BD4E4|nr:manganese efflux pump MntP family protein [uncultured Rikenella sp.]
MNLTILLLLALSLCFDSFAVSLSCGMAVQEEGAMRGRMFRFAVVLAVCQGVAPLIGWTVAANFRAAIEAYDHWVAFVLLAVLGGKMIFDAFGTDEGEDGGEAEQLFGWGRNVTLGIATSIDAVVAGVAMAMLPLAIVPSDSQWINMLAAVLVIAAVTLTASLAGLLLGRRSRDRIGWRAELVGGVILVLIGVKVLVEHLTD